MKLIKGSLDIRSNEGIPGSLLKKPLVSRILVFLGSFISPFTLSIYDMSGAQKKIVLSEDDYLACLSYILRRDYYPEAKADDDFEEAILKDHFQLDSFSGIDAFQARFTCQDDASFDALMQRASTKRKAKWSKWFGQEEVLGLTASTGRLPDQRLLEFNRGDLLASAQETSTKAPSIDRSAVRLSTPPFRSTSPVNQHAASTSYLQTPLVMMRTPRLVPGNGLTEGQSTPGMVPTGTPLMTWGRVLSTPHRLDHQSSPARDEAIRHILSKQSLSKKSVLQTPLRKPSPRSPQ